MKKDNKIDQLLSEWGRRQRQTGAPVDGLAKRISRAVREEKSSGRSAGDNGKQFSFIPFPRKPVVWKAAAAALFLAGLFVVSLWMKPPADYAEEKEENVAAQIAIEEYDAREKRIVMDEINALFDSNLSWLAEENGRIMIGLADEPSHKPGAESEPVLLKMLLLRRGPDSSARETLWQGNIISRSEQLITVSSIADDPDNTLTLWLYPLEAAGVLVDFELDFVSPAALKSSSSNHLLTRRPCRVLTLRSNGQVYEMYLSATSLKDEDKHPEVSM